MQQFKQPGHAREHSETGEEYTELALDESGTRQALLFANGVVMVQATDGPCIDLNPEQAMHFANAILAQSQQQGSMTYREFLESVEGNEQYRHWLDHCHVPKANEY